MSRTLLPLCLAAALGVSAAGAESSDATAIREKLVTRLPGFLIGAVTPTAVPGVYAVETDNGEMRKTPHVVDGGSHVIAGDLYALAPGGPVNRTEVRRESRRRELLGALDPARAIVFPATGARRTVFACVHRRRLPTLPGVPRGRYGAELSRDRGALPRVRPGRSRVGDRSAHGVGLVCGGSRRGARRVETRRNHRGGVLRRPGGGAIRTWSPSRCRRHADFGHRFRQADPRASGALRNGRTAGPRTARRNALGHQGRPGGFGGFRTHAIAFRVIS